MKTLREMMDVIDSAQNIMHETAGQPVDMEKWMAKYTERENQNYHTANVVALADLVGSPEDQQLAREIEQRHRKRGYIDQRDGKLRYEIHKRLWPLAMEKSKQ